MFAFAFLAVLTVLPQMQTPLETACDTNMTVHLIVAPTAETKPDCHRSAVAAACVVPRGYPPQPALGLALTGNKEILDVDWAVKHPDSAFSPGASSWVTEDDVRILAAAGIRCRAVTPTPTQGPEPPDPQQGGISLTWFIVAAGVLVLGTVLMMAYASFRRPEDVIDDQSLLKTINSVGSRQDDEVPVYTEKEA